MSKNILMIAYTNYLTDARVIREAEAAVKGGYQVDFFALCRNSEPRTEIVNGVNIYRLNQRRYRGDRNFLYIFHYLIFFFRCFFKVSWHFIFKRYQIIHVNNMPDFLVFTALIPKICGKKIILDIHDSTPYTFLTKFKNDSKHIYYKLLQLQERWSAHFANTIITVHDPIKNDILVADGIPAHKINIIINFADDSIFKPIKEYYIEKKIKLIFHGTIAERFGFDIIIDAITHIKNKSAIFLKIIGEGDYSEQLKQLISNHHLETIVSFDNQFYPVIELPEILKNYHLGLVPYKLSPATQYMLPVKMLDLWAMGIPVITIPNKAIQHYFNMDEYFAYDPLKSETLTKLIERLIQNPEDIVKKRERILKSASNYSWSHEASKYVAILDKLSN